MSHADPRSQADKRLKEAHAYLDLLRVRTQLFKAEFRDRKDDVLDDLQAELAVMRGELDKAGDAVAAGAASVTAAFSAAWDAFVHKIRETTDVHTTPETTAEEDAR